MNSERAAALYEKRKNAIEAIQRGEPVSVVARTHNVPLRTIFGWLARYRSGGWHALREGRRSGRPRKVSGELMQWLYEAITLGDPRQYQLAFCLWTLAIIRLVLKKEHGVELSKSAVCRLLQQMGLTPQRPNLSLLQTGPAGTGEIPQAYFPPTPQAGAADRSRHLLRGRECGAQ